MLPEAFLSRLQEILPPNRLGDVLATFASAPAVGFRLNVLNAALAGVTPSDIERRLAAEGVAFAAVPGVPGAYSAPAGARDALLASGPYADGFVYLQNVSSQVPPLVLAPAPGERVLDLCAAPGSKTGQLAMLMAGEGEIVAVEKVRPRYYRLRANVAAQGARNVRFVLGSGAAYWHREPEAFDRVMLDAPCSTEGRFRTDDPETTRYWSERKVREMRRKQERLLFAAVQALRPGGTLVYSTCTFSPEENEAVVDRALRTFGDAIDLEEPSLPDVGPVAGAAETGLSHWKGRDYDPRLTRTRRLLPDGLLEAFYVARLVKRRGTVMERARR